jgi:5-methylcytosine-specific restriction endonuclease McrBC GTP-binding regulatory subunit McrB
MKNGNLSGRKSRGSYDNKVKTSPGRMVEYYDSKKAQNFAIDYDSESEVWSVDREIVGTSISKVCRKVGIHDETHRLIRHLQQHGYVFNTPLVYGTSNIRNNSKITDKELEKEDKELENEEKENIIVYPKNVILYGPPGTGKTFKTINYALAIIENKSLEEIDEEDRSSLIELFNLYKENGQIEFITFHQNYAYEDFIQGLRPNIKDTNGSLAFELKDGIFKKIADKALSKTKISVFNKDESHIDRNSSGYDKTKKEDTDNYVIIIDEINRANISRVFGELITLIEEDKRFGQLNEMSTTLPSGEEFVVPPNLYIIGTMNTADKSIALIDIALRRRFDFEKLYPDVDNVINSCKTLFKKINTQVLELKGPDFQIGHAYFMENGDKKFNLKSIMNKRVIPLLYEYFMNDSETVKTILENSGIKTVNNCGLFEFESYSDE